MHHVGRRDGLLGHGRAHVLPQEGEVLPEDRVRQMHLAADAQRGRRPFDGAGRVGELDRELAGRRGDPAQLVDEVHMPGGAAELPVGGGLQAYLLLHPHGLDDLLVLDLPQLRGRDPARREVLARPVQARRAQQAADVVGAERRAGPAGCGRHNLTFLPRGRQDAPTMPCRRRPCQGVSCRAPGSSSALWYRPCYGCPSSLRGRKYRWQSASMTSRLPQEKSARPRSAGHSLYRARRGLQQQLVEFRLELGDGLGVELQHGDGHGQRRLRILARVSQREGRRPGLQDGHRLRVLGFRRLLRRPGVRHRRRRDPPERLPERGR